MSRSVLLYLQDIVDAITHIENYAQNIDKIKFEHDAKTQDAVIRRIEIIGEAVRNIPDQFREKYPAIPWKQIVGMRDVLIHAYLEVKIERVWKVIKSDLPVLKKQLLGIIKDQNIV